MAIIAAKPFETQAGSRSSSIVSDLGMTAVTEAAVFLSSVLVVGLVGRLYGAVLLSEYLLARRITSWMQSGVQLGQGVALPRYVASDLKLGGTGHFLSCCSILGCTSIIMAAILIAGRYWWSRLLFGETAHSTLIVAIAIMLIGMTFHVAVYGYYRGRMLMRRANALELLNLAIVPVSTAVATRSLHSAPILLGMIGTLTFLSSLAFAPSIFRVANVGVSLRRAWELVSYGARRVPGDFASAALFALGPLIAAHFVSLAAVSSLLLAESILTAMSVSVTPLGLVLLPRFTSMLAASRDDDVRANITDLIDAVVQVGVFLTLQVVVLSDIVLRVWLGTSFQGSSGVIRVVLLGAPFYLFQVALRSAIDARTVTAYNTRNLCLTVSVFAASCFCGTYVWPHSAVLVAAIALVMALVMLAALTAFTLRRLYDVTFRPRSMFTAALITCLGLHAVAFSVRYWLPRSVDLATVVSELFITALWLVLLLAKRPSWLAPMLRWAARAA